jgi:hypothetical protein
VHLWQLAAIAMAAPLIYQPDAGTPTTCSHLLQYLSKRDRGFYLVTGQQASIQEAVSKLGRRFLKGISAANRLFAPVASWLDEACHRLRARALRGGVPDFT